MFQGFIEGTAFRGAVLLSLKVQREAKRPKKGVVDIGLAHSLRPKQRVYILKVDLYEGSEIHRHSKQMMIELAIGKYRCCSKPAAVKDGRCEWFQVVSSTPHHEARSSVLGSASESERTSLIANDSQSDSVGPLTLPCDLEQCPDVFLYLCSASSHKTVSYLRMPFKAIVDAKWTNGPSWFNLKEDKAIDALNDHVFPGSLLLTINGGAIEEMPPNGGYTLQNRPFAAIHGGDADDEQQTDVRVRGISESTGPRQSAADGPVPTIGNLTVYVQQAQNLPAMDSNGKSDPFVKLKICDKNGNMLSAKTSTIAASLSPKWYQSFTFHLIPISETLKIKLYDFDKLSTDDLIGSVEILLLSQSNRARGVSFDVKNWYFINREHPDAKLQCRLAFSFLSTAEHKASIDAEKDGLRNTLRKTIGLSPTVSSSGRSGFGAFGQPTKKSMQLRIHLFQGQALSMFSVCTFFRKFHSAHPFVENMGSFTLHLCVLKPAISRPPTPTDCATLTSWSRAAAR